GFGTKRFNRWLNVRTGKDSKKRAFRKCHAVCGVKTNIITSVEITEGKANDSPMFNPLLRDTAKHFTVKEISADKAYSSKANLELAKELGAMPYIPFKSNVTGKSKGSPIWANLFKYFIENYMEFAEHYHKRSNIETCFAMIKRKFGDFVRCKNEQSQDNEILCKVLTHNLVVLIHEIFELKLEVNFNDVAKIIPAQKVV
ncbi:MAG: transposase, partial [Candidatus Nanoarchaeia archaeon]